MGKIGAAVVGFVNAVLGALVAFGVGLTDAQIGAVGVVVNTGIVLVALLWAYFDPGYSGFGRKA